MFLWLKSHFPSISQGNMYFYNLGQNFLSEQIDRALEGQKTHLFISDKVYYRIDTVKPLIDIRTEKVQSQSYAPYVFTSVEGIHSDATCFFRCVTFLDGQTVPPNHCDFYLRIVNIFCPGQKFFRPAKKICPMLNSTYRTRTINRRSQIVAAP